MNFIRFGAIPESGKSVNFMKLNFAQAEEFAQDLKFYGYESAIRGIPGEALESGVSCFLADSENLPILENVKQANSLAIRIGASAYMVSGEIVGTGEDGEPLVDVSSAEKIEISKETLIGVILSFLKKSYAKCAPAPTYSLQISKSERNLEIDKLGNVKEYYTFLDKGYKHLRTERSVTFAGCKFSEPITGSDDRF